MGALLPLRTHSISPCSCWPCLPLAPCRINHNPCSPEVHGACDVGPGVGADFQPFTLVRTLEGNVNLCSRTTPFVDRTTCPIGPDVLPEFQDATATSFFKMSQMYVDASGATPGAAYGVQRQPCTVMWAEGGRQRHRAGRQECRESSPGHRGKDCMQPNAANCSVQHLQHVQHLTCDTCL